MPNLIRQLAQGRRFGRRREIGRAKRVRADDFVLSPSPIVRLRGVFGAIVGIRGISRLRKAEKSRNLGKSGGGFSVRRSQPSGISRFRAYRGRLAPWERGRLARKAALARVTLILAFSHQGRRDLSLAIRTLISGD